MANNSVAGRKKSIQSANGLQIDTPVVTNTLLNKAASQSTSLYQQCSALRLRLMRIHDFSRYFQLASSSSDSRQSTDPVTHLWDLFSLGIPLCYIFNLLPPPITPINVNTDPAEFDVNDGRAKKRAIALFAMQIRQVSQCEPFTVTDLWDRNSTDGLVKVINTVTTIVDKLPEDVFEASPPSPPSISQHDSTESLGESLASVATNAQEFARNNIIREMVETERKYVQDLEVMQKYSNALSQGNILAQDEIHYLFPNLNKLLNFQRKFLIKLEGTAELPWQEQRWGSHFIQSEDEFVVYEPYCANYTAAADLMLANEQNLATLNGLINVKSELPAFLIKPVQRICKYPLLLDSLIKVTKAEDYPYYEELKEGSAAAKRITDKINEAQRRAENEQTVKDLEGRIEDWKGHHLSNFGELILDDLFVVKKSGVDREYHVFLFEKIILCCKDAPVQPNTKRSRQNGSLLKRPASAVALASGFGPPQKRNTPLLLKGRIFLNNVTKAVPVSPRNSTGGSVASYALEVWWRGDDDLEYFTLRCRTEEQLKQWETQINRLIKEVLSRRHAERGIHRATSQANSTNPALGRQFTQRSHDRKMSMSLQPHSPHLGPPVITPLLPSAISPGPITPSTYGGEDHFDLTPSTPYANGNMGMPTHYSALAYEGFEFDEDEFDEHGASSTGEYSGRGTPMGATAAIRRSNAMSMPPERDSIPGYDRPRAQTEDTNGYVITQWRTMPPVPLPATPAANVLPLRPVTPRLYSAPSLSSLSSTNETAGYRPASSLAQHTKTLRGQQSQTKIRNGHDDGRAKASTPVPSGTGPPAHRVRSTSQPTVYNASKSEPPPLPNAPSPWPSNGSATSVASNPKRGSGSSQSTGESSEYSPNSSSPITPFGSSESSLAMGVRPSRSQGFDNAVNGSHGPVQFPVTVRVKVHYHEDIFVIQVPRASEYTDLIDQVGKKIRLCGPRRDDGPLRVKYKDEDGDMVSVGSTEDVQMAFESFKPGGQVTLFVT